MNEKEKLLSFKEVAARVGGASRVTVWRWVQAGHFPAPIRIGLRKIAWRERDIETWLSRR